MIKVRLSLGRIGPGSSFHIGCFQGKFMRDSHSSTQVITLAVPDKFIVELYQSEKSFRKWCDNTIWPAELIAILEEINKTSATGEISLQEGLAKTIKSATLITEFDQLNDVDPSFSEEGYSYFVGSANTQVKIGSTIKPNQQLISARPPFKPRIIRLPTEAIKPEESQTSTVTVESNAKSIIETAKDDFAIDEAE